MKAPNFSTIFLGSALAFFLGGSVVSAEMEEGVYIYKTSDASCNGNCGANRAFLPVTRMVQKVVHTIPGSFLDNVKSYRFNLPKGYAVRFMDWAPPGTADDWLEHYYLRSGALY